MVFWIGALGIALVIAIYLAGRLFRRRADPAWPAAVGFALASLAALGAAVQATVASLEEPVRPVATAAAPAAHGAQAQAEEDSFDALVTRLEDGLKDNPKDPERWALLGRSYVALGRLDDAVNAFEEAISQTDPVTAGLLGEYGETLVAAAGGRVAGKAEEVFARILTMQPGDPRARYYLANAQADKGDIDGAVQALFSMLRTAPADAPWRQTVFERLQELSPETAAKEAPTAPPQSQPQAKAEPQADRPRGPTADDVSAAQDMTPEERQEMISGMVDGLAARLKENPADYQGWIRLANAYRVLGREGDAADALAGALRMQPANVGLLIQFAEVRIAADGGEIGEAAKTALERAEARQPGNPQVMWRLGQAAAASGQTEEARRRWTELLPRLLEADPLKAEVRAALDAL